MVQTASGDAAQKRPKLAIVVGLGWGIRNYLLSDTFSLLRDHFELLIISPYVAVPEFCEHFEAQGAQLYHCSLEVRQPFVVKKLFRLAEMAYYHRIPTASRQVKVQGREGLWRNRFVQRSVQLVGPRLFPLLRTVYRRLATTLWQPVAELRGVFRQEKVVGLFSTNCCEPSEWAAVLAAHAEGLPVVTALTSWDNPSTKRFPLCDYEGYLAWSFEMQERLEQHMEVRDQDRIHLTGAPQFDYYQQPAYQQSREEFCRQYGLDPNRKIIVYSTVTPGIMPEEPEVLAAVHDFLRKEALPGRPQLLVRLHPKDRLERYDHLRADPGRQDIVWTLAGTPRVAKKDQWCPDREDLVRAVNTLRHGDLNVHCRYSTMMLDFAALDKPVVVIAYDSKGSTAQALVYEQFEHLRPVLASGAIAVAYSPAEMADHVRQALDAPEQRRQARRQLVEYELGRLDGGAGARAGQTVIKVIAGGCRQARTSLVGRAAQTLGAWLLLAVCELPLRGLHHLRELRKKLGILLHPVEQPILEQPRSPSPSVTTCERYHRQGPPLQPPRRTERTPSPTIGGYSPH